MCTDRDPPPYEHGELIAEVDRLQGHNASLTATVKELRRQLAAAQRSGKRQAAPFSKGRRIDKPRRPGRKPGMGNFSYRKPPSADELSGPPVDVSVADDNCPGCGGVLEQEGVDVAYVTDIPAMPRPQVTEYRVQVCRCRGCGRRVRGRHAEVGADQYGASAHRVGRRVMAAAPRAPLWSGCSGAEGAVGAQSADRCGVEPGCDHPGRTATRQRCGGGCVPAAAGFGACESDRSHRRHVMASGR